MYERLTMNIRLEAFNVLNRPNFANPAGNLNSATFGQISSAASPRIFQAAAKFTF